jgi:hypothetical protein
LISWINPPIQSAGVGLADQVLAENVAKLGIQNLVECKKRLSLERKQTRKLVTATRQSIAQTDSNIEKLSNAKDLPDKLAIARTIVTPKNIKRKMPIHAGLARAVEMALVSQRENSVEILQKHENRVAALEHELKLTIARLERVMSGIEAPPAPDEELGGGLFTLGGVESDSQRDYNDAVAKFAKQTAFMERVWKRIFDLTPDDAKQVLQCAIDRAKWNHDEDQNSDDVDCVVRNSRWPPGRAVVRLVRDVRRKALTAKEIVDRFKQIEAITAEFCGVQLPNSCLTKVCERAVFPLIAKAGMSVVLTVENMKTIAAFERGCELVRRIGAAVLVDKGKELSAKDAELWRGLMSHCQLDAATATASDCVLPRAVTALQRLSTNSVVPGDMLRIIHSAIEEITRTPVTSAICADILLSLAMHVVAHANMPALRLHLAFIEAFAQADEGGELMYSFVNLSNAANIIAMMGKEVPACPQKKQEKTAVKVDQDDNDAVDDDDNDDKDDDCARSRKRRFRRHHKH